MRTTVDKVTAILEVDADRDEDVVLEFIDNANVFVTATLTGKGLSDAVLAKIEQWVAAHMIVTTIERQAKQEAAGGASITYVGEWGAGLMSTSYGQTAVALDTSLTLSAIAKGKMAASMTAITSFD